MTEKTQYKFADIVLKNRSFRKFQSDRPVSLEQLEKLIDLARTTPSSKNLQPLMFLPLVSKEHTEFVFSKLKWAWHLKDWSGPAEDEKPPAYIIVFLDTTKNVHAEIDTGICSQTILLGAVESGLGGCMIRTVNRYDIIKYFNLPQSYELMLVIAIGEPKQEVRLTEIGPDGKTEYFEDQQGVHYVPKRSLNDIIIRL